MAPPSGHPSQQWRSLAVILVSEGRITSKERHCWGVCCYLNNPLIAIVADRKHSVYLTLPHVSPADFFLKTCCLLTWIRVSKLCLKRHELILMSNEDPDKLCPVVLDGLEHRESARKITIYIHTNRLNSLLFL